MLGKDRPSWLVNQLAMLGKDRLSWLVNQLTGSPKWLRRLVT